jgi:hypothetical protein
MNGCGFDGKFYFTLYVKGGNEIYRDCSSFRQSGGLIT